MARVAVLITCLLFTILGQSFGKFTTKRSSSNSYLRCYQACENQYLADCASGAAGNKAGLICVPDGQVSWCQNACDKFSDKVEEQPVEDEEEYLSDDLKKREMDELKKLIGI
jgi:hypothetical protein